MFPQNSRVVIVDDSYEEIEELIKVLSKKGVSVTYFTGDKEELPEKPFNDVRIIFLDLLLKGLTGKDEKTIISTLMGVLAKIVNKENGPFIIVLWTKHPRYVEYFQKVLQNEGYCALIIDLEKTEFFETDGTQKMEKIEIYKKLSEKIDESIRDIDIFKIFILWENIVHNAAAITINEISQLIDFNEEWNNNMKKIFYKLARAWAGETLGNSSSEIIKSSLFGFDRIFKDNLEKLMQEFVSGAEITFSDDDVAENIIAKINSKFLLKKDKGFYPGNVYYSNKRKNLLEKMIGEAVDYDVVKEYYDDKGKNALSKTQFTNKILDKLQSASKLIEVELTPVCDFVQKKMKRSRIVIGFLLRGTEIKFRIPGKRISIPLFDPMRKRPSLIKSKTDYLYITPPFNFENELYIIILDFRYFSSISPEEIRRKEPLFRLRKEILNDIQTKLAFHVNRTGVLFVR